MKNTFIVAFIADIHFGAMKSDFLYEQLKLNFLNVLEGKKVDMIVFGGDMFHSIITMNYSTSHIVLMFMEEVVDLCRRNGIKYVRIIQGTMSHDNNQLHNFNIFENQSDVDFKIIMSVSAEKLPNGIRILYVPEEYMENQDEYYDQYLRVHKYYDFIFGHGMFKEVAFEAKNQLSEVTMSKAPVFDSKVFINSCRGPIYFGHIHTQTTIRDHIYYPGSFSRFKHGEELDKGWILCMYSIKSHRYIQEFIVNNMAPIYTTVTVEAEKYFMEHPEKIVSIVNSIKADFIRVKIVIKDQIDCAFALSYLNESFKTHSNIKVEIVNEIEFKKEKEVEGLIDKAWEKYHFIFEKGITRVEKIQKFIETKYDKTIPLEIIRDELNILE